MKKLLTISLLAAAATIAAQAAEIEPCQYEGGAALPVTITSPHLRPTIYGGINGNEVPMLVDTGAYRTFLTARYVERLGIPAKTTQKTQEGMGGDQQTLSARVQQFSIGPAKPIKGSFPVLGDFTDIFPYAAIVGADFLMQKDLMLDLGEGFLQFFYPRNCAKDTLIFPDATVLSTDVVSYDRRPHFTTMVNGVPMHTLIDTGAPKSVLDTAAAKRAGITTSMPGATRAPNTGGIGGGGVPAWYVPVATFEIGKETHANLKVEMAVIQEGNTRDTVRTDLILGMDFLRSYRVLFANSQEKVYLTKTAPLKLVGSRADWVAMVEAESAKGNAAATGALARILADGNGVPKDEARASKLNAEAVAKGDFHATSHMALEQFRSGDFSTAAPVLRKLSTSPAATRHTDLVAFIASAHNGERETALKDLQAARERANDRRWPLAVIDYMLGNKDAAYVLDNASSQQANPKARECEAHYYIAHANWLGGNVAAARNEFKAALGVCDARVFEHRASTSALKQLQQL